MRPAFILITVSSIALTAGPATAQQNEVGQPEWVEQARIVAQMYGISVGEAVRRKTLEDKVAALDARYGTDPDYGGAWIDQKGPQFRATFAFKRGGDKRQVDDVELAPVSNVVDVSYSVREIQQERLRLAALIKDASFSFSPKNRRLDLYPGNPEALKTMIGAGTITLAPFVTVHNGPIKREPEANVEGAGLMTGNLSGSTSTYRCVGGFVVTDGVRRGISTAGHCSPGPTDLKTHRGLPVGTRMGYQEYVDGLDISWFNNSGNTYLPRVRTSSTTYYTVTQLADLTPPPGTTTCLMRKDDTQACGVIARVTYFANNDGPYPTLDAETYGDGGDSGGTWFYGGKAFGNHSGDAIYPEGRFDFYTPVRSFPRMGINVVIGP